MILWLLYAICIKYINTLSHVHPEPYKVKEIPRTKLQRCGNIEHKINRKFTVTTVFGKLFIVAVASSGI